MSDLEEDLLALAGGAGSDFEDDDFESNNNNKRSASGATSQRKKKKVVQDDDEDDGYDFEDNDDEEEDDYDPEGGAGYDENEEDEEEEEPNPYPLEGKYKNERDRQELSEMGDVERESILFERLQELERFNERRLLRQRARQNQSMKQRAASATSRSQKVKESAKSIKSHKLNELKRQREKKSRRDRDYDDDEDDYEDEVEDDYDLGDDYDDGYEPDFMGSGKNEVEWAESSKRRVVTLADINNVRIGHSMAEKYCFYPGFNDIMVGTYGRIRVSQNSHRMVKIEAVVKGKPYKLRSGLKTDQYFSLSQPGKDKKNFQMTFLSDDHIHTEEFDKYNTYIEDAQNQGKHVYPPTVSELDDKFRALKAFSAQGLVGETFNAFLRNKSKFNETNKTGTSILDKKLELKQRLEEALQRNDQAKIHDYNKRLDELEKSFQKVNGSKVSMDSIAAKISEKNRRLNNTMIRKAEIRNNERKKQNVVSNADPFARLTTKARMYYQDTKKTEDEKAKDDALKALQEKQEKEKLLETKSCTFKKLGAMNEFIKSIDFKFDVAIWVYRCGVYVH